MSTFDPAERLAQVRALMAEQSARADAARARTDQNGRQTVTTTEEDNDR